MLKPTEPQTNGKRINVWRTKQKMNPKEENKRK